METIAVPTTAEADVFLNHYFALDAYLQDKNDLSSLFKLDKFEQLPRSKADPKALEKLLLNCWSAEYALRITPIINDEQYLQSSLHWTFPQAYYSVLFSARAFLAVQGINVSNEENIRKEVAKMVRSSYYPTSLGFYATGWHWFSFCRIATPDVVTERLHPNQITARNLINFLDDTRKRRFKALRNAIQANPKTALRSPKTGELLQHFGPEQYKQLAKQIGSTTYFDLLSRLRISSTSREIERFIGAEIDVKALHAALVRIVTHINTVHEKYVVQAIGQRSYLDIINALPSYLRGFLQDRIIV